MLNAPQIKRLLSKLERFADDLEPKLFVKVGALRNVRYACTDTPYDALPALDYAPAEPGMTWQG